MYQIQRLRPGEGVRVAQSCSFYYLAPVVESDTLLWLLWVVWLHLLPSHAITGCLLSQTISMTHDPIHSGIAWTTNGEIIH